MIDRVTGARYVVPLREGGSLPAVVDADTGETFVVKFRGAGQGATALVAELLAAVIALALDLPVPRPAVVWLDEGFGRAEPDPEIQDLLRGSVGSNFGLAYLPSALGFDPAVDRWVHPDLAADVVWFDAFLTNVDRTPRNPNLLVSEDRLWLIDHGAALYVHHRWEGWEGRIHSRFPQIKDHVLLPFAGDLAAADTRLRPRLSPAVVERAVLAVPDEWLGDEPLFPSLHDQRAAYSTYLLRRLEEPRPWLQEAIDAQQRGPERLSLRLTHRVV